MATSHWDKAIFQSTHPVWGATLYLCYWAWFLLYFNPRTPCGVRQPGKHVRRRQTEFQSTHPAWGATKPLTLLVLAQLISIHAPRVGCDQGLAAVSVLGLISIHAPRVGCDLEISSCSTSPWRFQSTHPVWGATRIRLSSGLDDVISIHAPRVGCDGATPLTRPKIGNFNPRTPCGVRPPRKHRKMKRW